MKIYYRFTAILLLLVVTGMYAGAQNVTTTNTASVYIAPSVLHPILEVVGDVSMEDPNGNNAIDADERCVLKMTVKNIGPGDGYGLRGRIRTKGKAKGITVSDNFILPLIKNGDIYVVEYPITADENTEDRNVEFILSVDEPFGINLPEMSVSVATRALQPPMVKFCGHVVKNAGNTLAKNRLYSMDITVQNVGKGKAEMVDVDLILPNGVQKSSVENELVNGTLVVGQVHTVRYSFIVPQSYKSKELPVTVKITEKYGRYSKDGSFELAVDQTSNTISTVIAPVVDNNSGLDLGIDVDENIPETDQRDSNLFVLIIANGNYLYGDGVSTAIRDGSVMREYCIKTLGALPQHVMYIEDADFTLMDGRILSFVSLIERHRDDGRFMFFYYGHGAPSPDRTGVPDAYLVPVNLKEGANMQRNAISRNWLMQQFQKAQPKEMVVCLEACFNGGTNEGGGKHVFTQANTSAPMLKDDVDASSFRGNMVLITASSGTQSAYAMPQRTHNVFTYQMLKLMKESKGNITWGELFRRARLATQDYTQMTMNLDVAQQPSCISSVTLGDEWQQWKLKKNYK